MELTRQAPMLRSTLVNDVCLNLNAGKASLYIFTAGGEVWGRTSRSQAQISLEEGGHEHHFRRRLLRAHLASGGAANERIDRPY